MGLVIAPPSTILPPVPVFPPNPCYIANQLANTVSIYSLPSDPIVPPIPIRVFGSGFLHAPTGLAVFTPPSPV